MSFPLLHRTQFVGEAYLAPDGSVLRVARRTEFLGWDLLPRWDTKFAVQRAGVLDGTLNPMWVTWAIIFGIEHRDVPPHLPLNARPNIRSGFHVMPP
jgi:hypothetical protein